MEQTHHKLHIVLEVISANGKINQAMQTMGHNRLQDSSHIILQPQMQLYFQALR